MRTLYLFDIDGTLRRCHDPRQPCPNRPGDAYLIPEARDWFARQDWSPTGDLVGLVSNQGGIECGLLDLETARQMAEAVFEVLVGRAPLPGTVRICPYNRPHPDRKPSPGMLEKVQRTYREAGYRWDEVLMVGDMASDREAAARAGVEFCWAEAFFGLIDGY